MKAKRKDREKIKKNKRNQKARIRGGKTTKKTGGRREKKERQEEAGKSRTGKIQDIFNKGEACRLCETVPGKRCFIDSHSNNQTDLETRRRGGYKEENWRRRYWTWGVF